MTVDIQLAEQLGRIEAKLDAALEWQRSAEPRLRAVERQVFFMWLIGPAVAAFALGFDWLKAHIKA